MKDSFLTIDNLLLETYSNLEESGICKAYTTTKAGGISKSAYRGLNLSFKVGDKKEDVLRNKNILGQSLKINLEKVVTCKQVHGNRVLVAKSDTDCKNFKDYEADALITNLVNVPIAVFTADCLSIFILDPINKVIGIVHAGWKSTFENISAKVLEAMQKEYQANPNYYQVALGPCIKECCYQISLKLAEKFINNFPDLSPEIVVQKNKAYYLNLTLINKELLLKAGVKESNIAISKYCTSCHSDYFFSHRRDKGKTGRMMSIMYLSS